MKKKRTEIFKKTAVIFFTVVCLFSLYLPFPKKVSGGETYQCFWADGSVTTESFTSAYQSLAGMDGESVYLLRDGLTGRIESGAKSAYDVLESGSFSELLSCTAEGTRIDGAALYRAFSDRVWYNGEYYVWSGEKIERVKSAERDEIVFLEGSVTPRILGETGASTVYLRAEAEITASAFAGSRVEKVFTEPPYAESGGAVYLDTAGGKRLLAALAVEELTLDEDLKFSDEGALLACGALSSLTLPFLGSAKSPYGSAYRGEFAYLFSDGKEYRVPETLARVRVTGGRIVPFAFYACPNLKEINACGVDPSEISETAFQGLASLEVLHTPKRDVTLTGNFNSRSAACGCTIYERADSQK